MKNLVLTSALLYTLSACSSMSGDMVDTTATEQQETTKIAIENSLNNQEVFKFPQSTINNKTDEEMFQSGPLVKDINFYVRGLMQDLITNLQYVNSRTPVAVTSFVDLDGDFNDATLLGNQISEGLMHEVHKAGIPVLDYKVTDYLRVTEKGDFIMSRNFNELSDNIPIRYVFTGNLVKHQGGYLVNARVVGIKSKAVVASAQSFIPATVAKALLKSRPETNQQQIPLVQG
ncbi:FlgO family outer membrane protein [Thalassotalea ganghwensis]